MDAEARSSTWRRRTATVVVICAGAAVWAGVAFGGGAGGAGKERGTVHKAVKHSHVARVQTRAHDGQCPFAHDGGAAAQV